MSPRDVDRTLVVTPGYDPDEVVMPTYEYCSALPDHLKRALHILIGEQQSGIGNWAVPRSAQEIIAEKRWTIHDLEMKAFEAEVTGSFLALDAEGRPKRRPSSLDGTSAAEERC